MDTLADLNLDTAVETVGTNWEFSGTPMGPAWENQQTNHRLIIDESPRDGFAFRVQLNHTSQCRPWWTVTEVDFPAELIPLMEWVLCVPDDDLFTEELVATMLDPFWNTSVTPAHTDDESSPASV